MQDERIKDGSIWLHKRDRYKVVVEQSSPRGYTYYRRQVSILENGERPIRRPKSVNFLKRFEEAQEE